MELIRDVGNRRSGVGRHVRLGRVEMLRQESAAEEQRERERLESRADRVVQVIERVLGEIDQQLDARITAPHAGLPATSEGLVLVFDQQSIQPVSPSVLVFYPVLPAQPEPPESLFAAAEADEFQRHALTYVGRRISPSGPIARSRGASGSAGATRARSSPNGSR